MFDIGFSELLLFGVIALIVLGPEKLPQAARTAGQWYAKMRRTVGALQSEIEAELDLAETRKLMQNELAKIRESEAEMRREMAQMRGNMREFESAQNNSIKTPASSKPTQTSAPLACDHSQAATAPTDDASIAAKEGQTQPALTEDLDTSDARVAPIITKPWENMWFVLGAYDKARRQPAPPYLPNHQADALLNASTHQAAATPTLTKEEAHI